MYVYLPIHCTIYSLYSLYSFHIFCTPIRWGVSNLERVSKPTKLRKSNSYSCLCIYIFMLYNLSKNIIILIIYPFAAAKSTLSKWDFTFWFYYHENEKLFFCYQMMSPIKSKKLTFSSRNLELLLRTCSIGFSNPLTEKTYLNKTI